MRVLENFINQDYYKLQSHENGNIMMLDLVKYIKGLDQAAYSKAIHEIDEWLNSPVPERFLLSVDLIRELKLSEYKMKLIEINNKIKRGDIANIPRYYSEFVEITLKEL